MKHQGTVVLQTERLILRPFTEEDAEAVFRNWANDPLVTRYLTWQPHKSVGDSLGFMRFCIDGYAEKGFYQWGIALKGNGEVFGNISVVHLDESVDAAEIGYVIGRGFWGNGYMAEALSAVIAFLFEEVGANRVFARHDANNPNSGRVMQKAGMKYEGTHRQSLRDNQGIVDAVQYAILKSDYLLQRKSSIIGRNE